jgi:YbbR domain-containing protein
MVFPGKEPIQEWLAGGYSLEAKPSKPLILSIFDPNSPGHDGALIMAKGKFTQFGVRLPISQSLKLPNELGTRHHAALGLTEKSDALTIVVSEERGTITTFNKGKFRQVNDREKLATTIVSHWNKTASFPLHLPSGRARWLVFSQILISLVLAMFFWTTLTINQSKILEKIVTVPVGYTMSPPNLILVGDNQNDVRLHLAGPKSDLDSINLEQLNVRIDLSKTVAGKQTFPINAENINLPGGVKLLDANPSSVELTLAEIEERDVTIKPQLLGKLPGGMKILSIRVFPEKVKVLSPMSAENNKEVKVITTPIYLESIYNDTKIFCKVIAPSAVQPANKRWPDVEVEIKVGY